ncbi:hypothetical protein [Corynebacterium provencense]|uniref:hypothetical protein n=1 Tax=Corynebacterium provencense TaxID=1737425 RepID=UPI00082A9547|nr:hypothetical protein [Corynebacterium provencense]
MTTTTNTTTTFDRGTTVLTGEAAYRKLADAWGVDVNDLFTDAHREAVADLKQWNDLTVTVTEPDVQEIVTSTDRTKWLSTIKKQSSDAVAARLINDAHNRVSATLDNRVTTTLHDDAAWEHVASVLDVDKAVEDYQNAINDLGETVYDAVAAAQANPNAFATYMATSPKLLWLDALGARWRDSAALHADIPDLPDLTYSKDGFGKITKHYDEATLDLHRTARKLRDEARQDRFLVDLALGKYPGFSLATTLQPDVYRARLDRLNGAGTSTQV